MSPGEVTAVALCWLLAPLAVTASTEAVAAWLLGVRTARELAIVALANLATNPAVNLLVAGTMALAHTRTLAHPAVLAVLAVLEALAVVAEWRIYHLALPDHRSRALVISVVGNAASFAVGLLVFGTGKPGV